MTSVILQQNEFIIKLDNNLLNLLDDKEEFNVVLTNPHQELQNTKARLVEDITTQLKSNYEVQLNNLNEQLLNYKEFNEQKLELANSQLNDLKSQLAKRYSVSSVAWITIVLIAAIIGALVGYLLFRYFGLT
jgi:hypothetical protein